jgi:hypothetical protein
MQRVALVFRFGNPEDIPVNDHDSSYARKGF